jgi:hypothetical protein
LNGAELTQSFDIGLRGSCKIGLHEIASMPWRARRRQRRREPVEAQHIRHEDIGVQEALNRFEIAVTLKK